MRPGNWYMVVKIATHGRERRDDVLDQMLPSWNPYAPRRKSPNEMVDTKNRAGDATPEGPNDGSMNGQGYNAIFDDIRHETLLDQYDDGSIANSPTTQDAPLDAVYDPPMNNGDGPTQLPQSPLGENKTVARMVEQQDPNNPHKDNHAGRLPGGRLVQTPKPFRRTRRSMSGGPLDEAWSYLFKKGM